MGINYGVTGTTWRCMTGTPSNGKCTVNRNVFVYRMQTGFDAENDMAVVFTEVPGNAFSNVSAADAIDGFDIGLVVNRPFIFYGRGYNVLGGGGQGVMRFMTDAVDWVGPNHFVNDAGQTRVCDGDSGGPYFNGTGGGQWQFGILQLRPFVGLCPGKREDPRRPHQSGEDQLHESEARERRPGGMYLSGRQRPRLPMS